MLPSKLLSASRNAFWSTSQSEHKIKKDSTDNFLIKDFQGWVLELKKKTSTAWTSQNERFDRLKDF